MSIDFKEVTRHLVSVASKGLKELRFDIDPGWRYFLPVGLRAGSPENNEPIRMIWPI
jgi:hypothetical protein